VIVNRFIIVFLSLSLIGCFGGGSSSVVSLSSSSSSKLDSGTSQTYNSSNATTQAATTEFQYFNYSSAASAQNPLEVINAHKAYGYGLTGSGETIAIIDAGFNTATMNSTPKPSLSTVPRLLQLAPTQQLTMA